MDVKKKRHPTCLRTIGVYNHLISSGPNKLFQAIVQSQNTVNYYVVFFAAIAMKTAFFINAFIDSGISISPEINIFTVLFLWI